MQEVLMTADSRIRALIAGEITAWALSLPAFVLLVNTGAAVSREDAEAKLGYKLPQDWDRVFIDHLRPQHWPFNRPFILIFAIAFTLCILCLLLCEWRLCKLSPKGGLMYRIWNLGRRRSGN